MQNRKALLSVGWVGAFINGSLAKQEKRTEKKRKGKEKNSGKEMWVQKQITPERHKLFLHKKRDN